jgi:acyl-ACP thioesterase
MCYTSFVIIYHFKEKTKINMLIYLVEDTGDLFTMYSFESRVRYSETDYNKNMTPSSIINYFQDCSNFQSEDLGVGIKYLQQKQRAWILCSWQLEINRFPHIDEKITIGTWPYLFKGMYGYRNFIMYDEQNNVVAVANTIWALMDTKAQRPAKILESDTLAYVLEPAYAMEYVERKLPIPDELVTYPSFIVSPSCLDMFHHVNNGQYIRIAQDYLPSDFIPHQVCADYRKSALLGDTLYPLLHIETDCITVALTNQEQQPYAIIRFK